MNETHYIYIVPPFKEINAERDPKDSGWELISDNSFPQDSNPYMRYSEYLKQVKENGYEWYITFRKYYKLDSVSLVLRCLDPVKEVEALKFVDFIFYKYIKECVASATEFRKTHIKYVLKRFDSNEQLIKEKGILSYFYHEKSGESALYNIYELNYYLTINFDKDIIKIITDNIITLLSLSEIARYSASPFLKENQSSTSQSDIVKAFWGLRFRLVKCPASELFPSFFKYKLNIIDNILDYRSMDLINQQSGAAKAQERALNEINRVDRGILYLTFFVSLDVLINISRLINENFVEFLIFCVLAILSSIILWDYILKTKE